MSTLHRYQDKKVRITTEDGAVFAEQNAMIDYDHNDTYLTVYDPDSALLDKLRALAAAEGLFVWKAPREG